MDIHTDDSIRASDIIAAPHCVLGEFSSLEQVVAYETGVWRPTRGYPRFVVHPFVAEATSAISTAFVAAGRALAGPLTLLNCDAAAYACEAYCGPGTLRVIPSAELRSTLSTGGFPGSLKLDVAAVELLGEDTERLKQFMQHTGSRPSSRVAEALLQPGYSGPESFVASEAAARIRAFVGQHCRAAIALPEEALPVGDDDPTVVLTNCGASAVTAVCVSLQREAAEAWCSAARAAAAVGARPPPRPVWLQLGWLYLDTTKALERLLGPLASGCSCGGRACGGPPAPELVRLHDVLDLGGLRRECEARVRAPR